MMRGVVVILTLMSFFPCSDASAAQYSIPRVRNVETKSGVPVMIAAFVSCIDHSPYEGMAFVQHGKVTMKRVAINQCGNPKEPATVYWYVSDPGFKGEDEANFSLASGSAYLVHITVR
jgi:hypothetical protein